MTLHLGPEATIVGSTDLHHYTARNGSPRRALLWANGAHNIAIIGHGTIDGQGRAFACESRQASVPAFRGEEREQAERRAHPPRPMLIIFTECEAVSLRDVCFKDSPSWGLYLIACDGVRVAGVRIRNRARPNGDGLDLESCRNTFVSDCDISCDDDAICLKSSIAGKPCEHIVITNCVITSNTAAVKFGTPSRAGFRAV